MQNIVTVAQALIDLFKKNQVECIFGVLGDAVFPFFDELAKQQDIRFYGTANEAGAAFMAAYYAKQTGKIGVCIATAGPGATNLANGLADAYFDRAPVLAVTGQVESVKLGTNAKQYVNQQQLLQAVTKDSQLIANPESLLPVAARMLARAVSERTATHLSIPEDVFSMPLNKPVIPLLPAGTTDPWVSGYARQVEQAIQVLESCRRPVMLVGRGQKQWRPLLNTLAETLGAGVVVAQQAKGILSDGHPQVVGGIGEAFLPQVVTDADCFLMVGSASYEMQFLPDKTPVVQLAEEAVQVDFSRTGPAVVGDTRRLLKLLNERVTRKKNPSWLDKIKLDKQSLAAMRSGQEDGGSSPVHPARMMLALSRLLPKDAVIVCDVGAFIHWFDTYFQADQHDILVSSHWRGMGGGLPGALGICAAQPGRKVITLTGDGGLLMSLGELATAAKYGLPVTVIVANNSQYNLEKTKMQVQGLQPFGYELQAVDFAAAAGALGVHGQRVEREEQLDGVLAGALSHQGPALVDVVLQQVDLPLIK